jgi:hypothetical protein
MANNPMIPDDPLERAMYVSTAKETGMESEKKETRIITPEEVVLNYEESVSVLKEDGSIETKRVSRVKEFKDGLIVNPDGKIIAVRCQHSKCSQLVSSLDYYECKRCGRYYCRHCVKQKSYEYFCSRCWKILTFFPYLQKKYLSR